MPCRFYSYLCSMRLDKWLWSVRLSKTREEAATACRNSRVSIGGAWCKPAREVAEGDQVSVRKGAVTLTFRVLGAPVGRQPARNVQLYAENITPQSELDKLAAPREVLTLTRDRGTGRPTKKERRDIDELMEEFLI